jgi:hypothetical protein
LPGDDFYVPTDLDALRMENELLAFEVRFLRSRLGWTGRSAVASASLSRLAHLEEAERDLVLLVGRLARSPLGPVLRASGNFRTLEGRYLHSPESQDPTSPNRVAYLEGAEKDLVLLLRRLGSGPLGRVFRTRGNFRTLEQRYL